MGRLIGIHGVRKRLLKLVKEMSQSSYQVGDFLCFVTFNIELVSAILTYFIFHVVFWFEVGYSTCHW